MPELPEVEVTRLGIAPRLAGRKATDVVIRNRQLRWPVTPGIRRHVRGRRLDRVERRSKYLLFHFETGVLMIHLGMSGSLRVIDSRLPAGLHDHVDIQFGARCLRFTDPRRFGSVLWAGRDWSGHALLRDLGPEPLEPQFSGEWLYRLSRGRGVCVKNFLMDSKVVVGVGNIYASESLFDARIDPRRKAGRIGPERYDRLVCSVRGTLRAALEAGGTTLRDFSRADGQPGYFARELKVYGRASAPCERCATPIRRLVLGQRATYFCPACQK